MSKYVPARVAQEQLGVSLRTLLRWDEAGKIETLSVPPMDKDDITSNQSLTLINQRNQFSCTPELAVILKNLTLRDKLTFFSLVSPTVNSSKKSRRVSTSKEKNFVPYWNEFSQEMFQWLWSVIKTDSPVSVLNLSNGSAKDKVVNSWFSNKVTSLQNEKWSKISLPPPSSPRAVSFSG